MCVCVCRFYIVRTDYWVLFLKRNNGSFFRSPSHTKTTISLNRMCKEFFVINFVFIFINLIICAETNLWRHAAISIELNSCSRFRDDPFLIVSFSFVLPNVHHHHHYYRHHQHSNHHPIIISYSSFSLYFYNRAAALLCFSMLSILKYKWKKEEEVCTCSMNQT